MTTTLPRAPAPPTNNTKFVVLLGIDAGNVLWTSYDPKKDTPDSIVLLTTGELAYEVIAFCDTAKEAQNSWRANHWTGLWRQAA